MTLHADEWPVDEDLVARLLAGALPHLAHLPVARMPRSGSTNALFALGDDLLVRVARQPGGGDLVKEHRWTPYVAGVVGVAVPEVLAVVGPGDVHPGPWSVTRRLPGRVPTATTERARPGLARDLGAVLRALREAPVPAAALADPDLRWYRAEPLARIADEVADALAACRRLDDLDLDLDAVERVWRRIVAAPAATRAHPPRWLHGDLVAENLLVDDDDRLVAVLDLGGLAVGDPAVDAGAPWELLGPDDRLLLAEVAGLGEEDRLLGCGWVLAVALMTFPYYGTTMPQRCHDRLVAARAVVAELG